MEKFKGLIFIAVLVMVFHFFSSPDKTEKEQTPEEVKAEAIRKDREANTDAIHSLCMSQAMVSQFTAAAAVHYANGDNMKGREYEQKAVMYGKDLLIDREGVQQKITFNRLQYGDGGEVGDTITAMAEYADRDSYVFIASSQQVCDKDPKESLETYSKLVKAGKIKK